MIIDGSALVFGETTEGQPNSITTITVNGSPVDIRDAANNFFSRVLIQPGANDFRVEARDEYGQTAHTIVRVFGEDTSSGIDFDRFADITGSFSGVYGRTSFDDRSETLFVDLATRNDGRFTSDVPLLVGVRNVSDPLVSALDPDGVTPDGIPYYDFTMFVDDGRLDPNELTESPTIAFSNPGRRKFTYDLVFFGQLNEAPVITSLPRVEALAGRAYEYDTDAEDVDGDTLGYSLVLGPDGMSIDAETGLLTWTPESADVGNYDLTIGVSDGRGSRAEQRYTLSVIEAPPNRPPIITSDPVTFATLGQQGETNPTIADLSQWEVVQYLIGNHNPPNANWVISDNNTTARQTINAEPSILLSDFDVSNTHVSGSWRVDTTDDDDWMGFVFGYQDRGHFYLFRWAQGGENNEPRMQVLRYDEDSTATDQQIFDSGELLFENSVGWQDLTDYDFDLDFHPGRFTIEVRQGGNLVTQPIVIDDSRYTSGRFGFYNSSQGDVVYRGFAQQAIAELTYQYDVEAFDPDFDPVMYLLCQYPTGMVIDPDTGVITWGPTFDQVGNHPVAVEVNDGRGGMAVQEFTVAVKGNPLNHPPIFVSAPIDEVSIDSRNSESDYLYDSIALDSDADTLTYRVQTGPTGMTIDDNGVVNWRPTLSDVGQHPVSILAADGRGGVDLQSYNLTVSIGDRKLSGYKFEDLNANGILDTNFVAGDSPDIIFILDRSCSMDDAFSGTPVGDINGDGRSNTLFDASIAGILASIDALRSQSFTGVVEIGLIDFSGGARVIDVDKLPGNQAFTGIDADSDSNGVLDFQEAIVSLRTVCQGTNFEAPLQSAIAAFSSHETVPGDGNIIFLSDGVPNAGGSVIDEVATLRNAGVNLQAFGIGSGSSLSQLALIDPDTRQILSTDELLNIFSGLDPGSLDILEPVLPGWDIFVDLNGNASWDLGEPIQTTDADGFYSFEGFPPEVMSIAEIAQPGWVRTTPLSNPFPVDLGLRSSSVVHFGSVRTDVPSEQSPSIDSLPVSSALVGELYRYDVLASDPQLDELTYALPLAPPGMTINPDRGTIVWVPTSDQSGVHTVLVRVRDSHGNLDVQTFDVEVPERNVLPIFASQPPSSVQVNATYVYHVQVQDGNGDEVTVTLQLGQPDVQFDQATKRLSWIPSAEENRVIRLQATDGRGGESFQEFTVSALASLPNADPEIVSTPRSRMRLGVPYVYIVDVTQDDADPLTFSLDTAPSGMTIDTEGVVMWDDPPVMFMMEPVTIRVEDGRGGVDTQSFDLEIVPDWQNSDPVISSNPPRYARADRLFAYDLAAEDADGDDVIWRIVSAPDGVSVDQMTGKLRWIPALDQVGVRDFVIEAMDSQGATDLQKFSVEVTCVNLVPTLDSVPPTEATTGRPYFYAVRASDPEGESLRFELGTTLAGMTMDEDTGLIRWVPDATFAGRRERVTLTATDPEGGFASQAYEIEIADGGLTGSGNHPPIITSSPVFYAEVDQPYSYVVTATDPNGDTVTYDLLEGPATMSLEATTGRITWTPVAGEITGLPVTVVVAARDDLGAIATQGYSIELRQNGAPQITSTAVTDAIPGATYRYTVQATDPENDTLDYRLDPMSPPGMTIDAFGRIIWQVPEDATLGSTVPVEVTAADTRGAADTQSYTIEIQPDTSPPNVGVQVVVGSVTYVANPQIDINSSFTVRVGATDNVRVANMQLMVDGQLTPLDTLNQAVITAATLGDIEIVATATDPSGNTGQDQITVSVVNPGSMGDGRVPNDPTLPPVGMFDPNDDQRPIVEITNPVIANPPVPNENPVPTVNRKIDVTGTVDDPEDNLWYYRVYYAPADQIDLNHLDYLDPDWVQIGEGTDEVFDGKLGEFDPTILKNNQYALIVVAFDNNAQGWIEPTLVNVEGNLKFGNFRLPLTDLSISLAGIPITINRVYDTLDATAQGDFGYGWALGIQDGQILEAAGIGEGGAFNPGNVFLPNITKVYLTDPNGQRIGFTYKEELISGSFFGAICRPYFEADPGVYSTLTIDETQSSCGGAIGVLLGGINPSNYTLTTKDGLKYRYHETRGLQRITDLNGNVVTFTGDTIAHSSGDSLRLIRDTRGRIKEVQQLDATGQQVGESLVYRYNLAGELASFTDASGVQTTYVYRDEPAHFLRRSEIDGRLNFTVNYDEQTGQLIDIVDGAGNPIQTQDYAELDAGFAIIRDANGNPTRLLLDDRGNVLAEEDPLGNITYREYSDLGNPDLETRIIDRRDMVTERDYDVRGNVMEIRELGPQTAIFVEPIVTSFTYDTGNRVTSITNANNRTTTFHYDTQGNLEMIENELDDQSFFTYDSMGRRETFTDFNGNVSTFEYTGNESQPTRVIFDDDTYQVFAYNQYGQVTLEQFFEADDTLVEQRETHYDPSGRVIEEISGVEGDPNHPATIVRRFYDGDLLDWEIIVHPDSLGASGNLLESPTTPVANRLSRITDYEYNSSDQLIRQTDAEDGIVEFRYDAQGNRLALMDPVGNITSWVYDELNRVSEERDPFYWENVRATDAAFAGLTDREFLNLIAPEVPGNLADPLYDDDSGVDCATNTGAEHIRLTCYDEEGNQEKTIDRNGRRREFEYDHAGRLEEERWYNSPDHTTDPSSLVETITFSYDDLGNMLTATDRNSNYLFTYDTLNRLESVDNNPDGTRDVPHVILTYGYDAQGNVTLTQDNFGVTVESQYNSRNLLEWRRWFDADGGGDVDDARVDFQYSATGRESGIRRYSDLDATTLVGTTTRTYDLAGRSDILIHENTGGSLLAGYDYGYDFSGLLNQEDRTHQDSQFAQSIDYDYDLTGQLTDAMFNPVAGSNDQDDEHYEYDANGNRLFSEVGSEQRTYTPDTANQLESDGQYRYEYDGEGNQIKRVELATGETRTFEYDHRNRLVRVDDWSSDPGDPQNPTAGAILTQSVTNTFDIFMRRITVILDRDGEGAQQPERESYVYNSDNVWLDANHTGQINARYVFGNRIDDNLIRFANSEVTWYLGDNVGTVRDLVDASGVLVNRNDFGSFGQVISQSNPGEADRFAFTGREFDTITGQYYYRARFLNPDTGRFQSLDPIGLCSGDVNGYRYVFNSPLRYTDPTGNIALITYIGALSFASGFLAAATYCKDLGIDVAEKYPNNGQYNGEKDFMRHCTWLCCSNRFGLIVAAPAIWFTLGPAFEVIFEFDENFNHGAEGYRRLLFDVLGSDIAGIFASVAPAGCEAACQGIWASIGP